MLDSAAQVLRGGWRAVSDALRLREGQTVCLTALSPGVIRVSPNSVSQQELSMGIPLAEYCASYEALASPTRLLMVPGYGTLSLRPTFTIGEPAWRFWCRAKCLRGLTLPLVVLDVNTLGRFPAQDAPPPVVEDPWPVIATLSRIDQPLTIPSKAARTIVTVGSVPITLLVPSTSANESGSLNLF